MDDWDGDLMKRICITLLMIAVILTGCYQKGTAKQTGLFAPYRIADVNVPLADNLHTSQFDRVEELETDEYGRCYYSYKTYSVTLSSDIEIHIISQMVRDDEVFFYPDYCYRIRLESDPAFTDEDISQLKTWNDWNQPLVTDKMYTTSYSQYHKDIANEKEIQSAITSYLDLDDSYGINYNGLDLLDKNAQLFFVHVFPRANKEKSRAEKYYLVIYQKGVAHNIARCQQLDDPQSCQEQVWMFRCAWPAEENSK